MPSANTSSTKTFVVSMTLAMLAVCGVPTWGQGSPADAAGSKRVTGVPDDWTHHHLFFSDPGTEDSAFAKGNHDEWLGIVNDPRYILQQLKRHLPAQESERDDAVFRAHRAGESTSAETPLFREPWVREHEWRPAIEKDWSMILGSGATKVGEGMYPAKFSFNATSTSPINCGSAATPDFVVFNTSAAGSSTQASIVAYDNIYSSCTGQVPSVYWAFNTGGTVETSAVLYTTGTQLAFIQTPSSGNAQLVLLKWGAKPAGRNVTGGVTISSTAFTTTTAVLTSMDVGAGISGTGIPIGDTIATVTSATAGTLTTAATATHAGESLAITADAGGPDTLTAVSNANYSTCSIPCMTTLSFSGTTRSDTTSSPFYDYTGDTIYVGDASGGLHKFHPVFSGTPAEVGTPWTSPSTTAISSPVYDSSSGNVFVGDASGFLYSINSSGTIVKSFQVAVSPGIIDGPLIDSTNQQLYAVVSTDTNASNTGTVSTCLSGTNKGTCNGVINLPTTFTATTQFAESVIGVSPTNTLYSGAFDNLYWTTGTGNLYTVGGNAANEPKLMEIPVITTGIASTSIACANPGTLPNCSLLRCANNIDNPMTSAAAASSPVTEILNGTTDYIFTGVSANVNSPPTGCSGACVESWIVTTALTGTTTAASAGSTEAGGTSGIIIDNTSATAGASEIYFSTLSSGTCTSSGTLTSGGCAVQASQTAP